MTPRKEARDYSGESSAEWQQQQGEQDDARDEAFDTALHLASHAQRLKNLESHVEQITHILHDMRRRETQARSRQDMLLGLLAAAVVVTALFSAFWPRAQAPARAQQAEARIQAQAQNIPGAAVQIQQAGRPSVVPGQASAYTSGAPISAFESRVETRLAARGERSPLSWRPFFEREATGDAKGKLLVAAKLLRGDGVSRDQAFAVELIRQAANSGDREAMMWLAYAHQGGHIGGQTDLASAARWFEAAGKAGQVSAYTELGRLYETGIDGAPDIESALAWYQLAAKGGETKAAEAIARLANIGGPVISPMGGRPPRQQAAPAPQRQPQQRAAYSDAESAYPENSAAPPAATPVAASVPVPAALVGMSADEAANEIRAVQRGLKALGYKINHVDGAYGPATAAAIRAFQRANNLFPDGEPSAELLDAVMKDLRYGN